MDIIIPVDLLLIIIKYLNRKDCSIVLSTCKFLINLQSPYYKIPYTCNPFYAYYYHCSPFSKSYCNFRYALIQKPFPEWIQMIGENNRIKLTYLQYYNYYYLYWNKFLYTNIHWFYTTINQKKLKKMEIYSFERKINCQYTKIWNFEVIDCGKYRKVLLNINKCYELYINFVAKKFPDYFEAMKFFVKCHPYSTAELFNNEIESYLKNEDCVKCTFHKKVYLNDEEHDIWFCTGSFVFRKNSCF